MASHRKYHEYFSVDEKYFPCIDDAAIDAGAPWENTYPHAAFIDMLTGMERALARQNGGKTLWIEGAYGTGKSQCALALRRILEASEEELRAYWNSYEPLKKKRDLCEKLIGHKKSGIVVAHRYASGGIMSARDLFFAVQESVKEAVMRMNLSYLGENTLKESIIAWLDDVDHKQMFNSLLNNRNKEWGVLFSQGTADEVIAALRKSGEVKSLVDNIFRLADKEGITALTIDSDRLIAWLTDVIDQNKTKIVLIWDEFSDYFRNNRESLSEFQKIASLVQNKPFYFIVVTHEPQRIYVAENDKGNQSKVSDRFISIPITLPDNIAFDLIGHAFNVKPAAKKDWSILADDLNDRVKIPRTQVMAAAEITEQQVIKDIMPIHPMAALILKNIASAFQSNQRSMFDFIKTANTDDVKAFQWFIKHNGPYDEQPLLTVDMLWNFFYEKGRDNLAPDIRLILDTYPQQRDLREDEQTVLKAILIMQAIDQRLGGGVDLFKPTEQNLSYVFEGIPDLEGNTKAGNIAKGLKEKGILISNPMSNGRHVYAAAVLAGDQVKIDSLKKNVRQNSTTGKLVAEGGLSTVLSLSPALRLRFESESGTGKITAVTKDDFTRTINNLRERATGWNFHAVIAFAKDDAEAAAFRKLLRAAVADRQYESIVFIDALSTPLGEEAFEQFVDFSAMAGYYQGNQNASSREYSDKAKRVLDQDWKNRLYNGQFVVYTYANQDGEKFSSAQNVAGALQTVVTNKFPCAFDFAKGLTEVQLKATGMKQSAQCGISQVATRLVVGLEKHVLPTVWNVAEYWSDPANASLPIVKIKNAVDRLIETAFAEDGQISIGEIYGLLEDKYGFAPCNLSAFLTGFLLKEYGVESYRYSDSSGGHEQMTPDKLAEMIGNHFGRSPKPTYIVKMTPDEMAFYDLTEKAWGVSAASCSSAGQAASAVAKKMREMQFPIWCLEEIDDSGAYDMVRKYIELIQSEGKTAHRNAVEIGKAAAAKPAIAGDLAALITKDNCQKGMQEYLRVFADGKVMELAKAIGAQDNVLADTRRLFDVKHACLWDKKTGEDEIRKLLTEYGVVKESNSILNGNARSLDKSYAEWREKLKFIGISHEALLTEYPGLAKVFDVLLKIYRQTDIIPDQQNTFHAELGGHGAEIRELLNDDKRLFATVYAAYLEDLGPDEIAEVKSHVGTGLFDLPKTSCNIKVKEAAEKYREKQLKSQLFLLWKDKTGTKNPDEWSTRHRTPILCLVPPEEYPQAKKTFGTLNRNTGTESEIKDALEYLDKATLFALLSDETRRDAAFKRDIVGSYSALLPNLNTVREALSRLPVEVYDWRDNPSVKARIEQLANAEYEAGGSDKVLEKIDGMDDARLKQYLKQLVKDNMTVGIEILTAGD